MMAHFFLWFVFYSMFGWLWEVSLYLIDDRKFVNRGFLNGPYCPVYGFGALLILMVLGNVEDPVALFFLSAIFTCSLEYLTSWGMEKIFRARWWDYSERPLNINGRVCMIGAIAFGSLSVLMLKIVHPTVLRQMERFSETELSATATVLFTLMSADLIYTVTKFSAFEKKLRDLNEKLNARVDAVREQKQAVVDRIQESAVYTKLSDSYEEFLKDLNAQERRILKAFPKLRSLKYDSVLKKIRERLAERLR